LIIIERVVKTKMNSEIMHAILHFRYPIW